VTQNQESALGLSGLVALSNENSGEDPVKYTDLNTGTVIALYVEQDKKNLYLVDEEGKRIGKLGDTIDLNKVVFSTMPTTHLFWRDGKTARFRDGEQEEASIFAKRWEAKRKQIFDAKVHGGVFKFVISRGIPDIRDNNRFSVSESLVPEEFISQEEGLVVIPTTGTLSHNGKLINFPNGRPVLQYQDTLQFLSNNNFTNKQAQTIFEILKRISNQIKEQTEKGEKVAINRKYINFLQNVLFYKAAKERGFGANQIFINTSTMELMFGDQKFDITNIEQFETPIIERLLKTFNSVNNYTLTKTFNQPFTELYLEGEELKERQWKNYQVYLLSSKYPDGSTRSVSDIPLSTNVQPPTEGKSFNYSQKYAILQELELPEVVIKPAKIKEPKKEEITPVTKIGEYTIDGTTKNAYNLKSGPVEFTARIDEANNIVVSVEENETVITAALDDNVMKTVIAGLKSFNRLDAAKGDKELLLDFIALQIAANLEKQRTTKPEVEVQDTSSIEQEYDAALRPEIPALSLVTAADVAKAKTSEEVERIQKELEEIQKRYNDLQEIRNCAWKI